MKFDVIVSNPPYNNNIYIDLAKEMYNALNSNGQMILICPVKWMLGRNDIEKEFGEFILSHINNITYYPNVKDIFNVGLDGLVIFSAVQGQNFEQAIKQAYKDDKKYYDNISALQPYKYPDDTDNKATGTNMPTRLYFVNTALNYCLFKHGLTKQTFTDAVINSVLSGKVKLVVSEDGD
jgi:hypothetical protein